MRVSIVATALDGQQPESKSVINMVHRIQNRNPGYYDASVLQKNNHLNNSNFISSTSGANALQVDSENIKETESELLNSMVDENMALDNLTQEVTNDNVKSDTILNEETVLNLENNNEPDQNNTSIEKSNGLENFDLSDETPQLFNNEDNIQNDTNEEDDRIESEDDELEIPAFLRRQKN